MEPTEPYEEDEEHLGGEYRGQKLHEGGYMYTIKLPYFFWGGDIEIT